MTIWLIVIVGKMIKESDDLRHPEPIQGYLFALKSIILRANENISQGLQYQFSFFYYKGMNLTFLWVQKKKVMVGFIIDKRIYLSEKRTKRKDDMETILLNPNEDIPIKLILENMQKRLDIYENL